MPTAFDEWLTLAQTLAILLLWLFYIGRWVGQRESKTPTSITPPHNPSPDHTRMKTLEAEMDRARDRLHQLEGFKGITETRLKYIERELERGKNGGKR